MTAIESRGDLRLVMSVDGEDVCQISVFADLAPALAGQLEGVLPDDGILSHARVAGDMVFWTLPFSSPWENLMRTEEVGAQRRAELGRARGAVCWYSPRQQLCVVYGDDLADENLRISYIGEVVDGFDALALRGLECWLRPGQRVSLRLATPEEKDSVPARRSGHSPEEGQNHVAA